MIKMTIGEIVDRYTICKLKSEKTDIDCAAELLQLKEEIKQYDSMDSYIDSLYKINGDIWALESDIRKGKENILGMEEVGKRAIQIRNYNSARIQIKNDINSKYREGFIETKVDHGSQLSPAVVISLTTVPPRLANTHPDGLMYSLRALCTQQFQNYEVHINIPHTYNVTQEEYIIPAWLHDMQQEFSLLKVFRTEDYGPPTKIIPTLHRVTDNETIIIIVDDDMIYHEDLINEHVKYQSQVSGVIGYDGRGARQVVYNDIRDSWVLCTVMLTRVDSVQCYRSVSVRKKYFQEDFFTDWVGKTKSDDMLLSYYLRYKNIHMYIAPYEPEIHLVDTREKWDAHQVVFRFPILRQANSVADTGCHHPDLLKMEPKFFVPAEFEQKVRETDVR